MKKILVTGADGFIGSLLVPQLISKGYDVVTFSIKDGDIGTSKLEYADLGLIIHLAALTFVPDSWVNTLEFYRVNVMGTTNVLELCRKNNCGIVFMSTYVYGAPRYSPIDELHPVAPNSPYNHSKVLGEDLCRFYHDTFEVPVTVFRPFNIYGPGQARHFLIPEIFHQLLDDDKPCIVLKDLMPERDYIFVDDVVKALVLSVEKSSIYSVFNLGSGVSTSVADLANCCLKVSGIHKEIKSMEQPRVKEVTGIVASIKNAESYLNWAPGYSLEQGLSLTLRSLQHEKVN